MTAVLALGTGGPGVTVTAPLPPTPTTTKLATGLPGVKLTFDATGTPAPDGETVRKPGCVGASTVTLSATASTPVAGTPATFVTATSALCPNGSATLRPPVPLRVSNTRVGVTGKNSPPAQSVHA